MVKNLLSIVVISISFFSWSQTYNQDDGSAVVKDFEGIIKELDYCYDGNFNFEENRDSCDYVVKSWLDYSKKYYRYYLEREENLSKELFQISSLKSDAEYLGDNLFAYSLNVLKKEMKSRREGYLKKQYKKYVYSFTLSFFSLLPAEWRNIKNKDQRKFAKIFFSWALQYYFDAYEGFVKKNKKMTIDKVLPEREVSLLGFYKKQELKKALKDLLESWQRKTRA